MILETLPMFGNEAFNQGSANAGALGAFIGLGIGIFILILLLLIGLYVYTSWAFMSIAKKAGYDKPGLAWIPFLGPTIVSNRIAKMHWWPFLLLIGYLIPFISIIAAIAFAVFSYIWLWKTFEAVDRPGWWPLLGLIPIIGGIIFIILLGITAWGKK